VKVRKKVFVILKTENQIDRFRIKLILPPPTVFLKRIHMAVPRPRRRVSMTSNFAKGMPSTPFTHPSTPHLSNYFLRSRPQRALILQPLSFTSSQRNDDDVCSIDSSGQLDNDAMLSQRKADEATKQRSKEANNEQRTTTTTISDLYRLI